MCVIKNNHIHFLIQISNIQILDYSKHIIRIKYQIILNSIIEVYMSPLYHFHNMVINLVIKTASLIHLILISSPLFQCHNFPLLK